jgi:hypothetical protein
MFIGTIVGTTNYTLEQAMVKPIII